MAIYMASYNVGLPSYVYWFQDPMNTIVRSTMSILKYHKQRRYPIIIIPLNHHVPMVFLWVFTWFSHGFPRFLWGLPDGRWLNRYSSINWAPPIGPTIGQMDIGDEEALERVTWTETQRRMPEGGHGSSWGTSR